MDQYENDDLQKAIKRRQILIKTKLCAKHYHTKDDLHAELQMILGCYRDDIQTASNSEWNLWTGWRAKVVAQLKINGQSNKVDQLNWEAM